MSTLPDDLFALVESKTLAAREAAEKAARNILSYLKLADGKWWGEKEDPQRNLWLGLRARARQLGYALEENGEIDPVKRGIALLTEKIAYEQWHRMLFARFLAENNLLMHPSGVPVSLQDCEELAPKEGEDDAWRLAARYTSVMLPDIFHLEDPCAQVPLTPSDHHKLESILLDIPKIVFTCDDSLGWMYQFWQSKKKDEVNASERKIGGADLPPVTQLFTEDYMVRFLLENSLGAWWAARHPSSPLIKEWEYLRFKEDGTPAAGTFPGWPERAAEVTVMDPCCGSGHFLIAAFDMLRRMRMEEEGINPTEATIETLRDNIFGLEIDQRCTQIAGFALSLIGWKTGGYQKLPELNVACTGIPVQGQLESWLELAGDDSRLKAGLERLYNLFKNAPDLGSLINPGTLPEVDRMFVADYEQVGPLFEQALVNEKDNFYNQVSITGQDLVKATKFLNGKYVLVTTNVPYLGYKKQDQGLKYFIEEYYPKQKMDLATVFIERCNEFCHKSCSTAIVAPQNWLFLGSYKKMREELIKEKNWNILVSLGGGKEAFRAGPGNITSICIFIISNFSMGNDTIFWGIDASIKKSLNEKVQILKKSNLISINQKSIINNPDFRISFASLSNIELLERYAIAPRGIVTGDTEFWTKYFWELPRLLPSWKYLQVTVEKTQDYGGRNSIIFWKNNGKGMLRPGLKNPAYNHIGIVVNRMAELNCTLYTGELYDQSVAIILPKKEEYLNAIWQYCKSPKYRIAVRNVDKKLGVTPATLVKVPFDLGYWQKKAEIVGPIPIPISFDPTQWIFEGNPVGSTEPLHVIVAQLLGYRWPKKLESISIRADEDGIVCLPSIRGELAAAERIRALLATAYGSEWSAAKLDELLAEVGYSGKDLAAWLQDGFFEQHCKLFHNRPFIWHIWDGRKDGFSALVNYHKLDHANLEKLTYTYLGSWIQDRKSDMTRGIAAAEGRFLAAQALQDKLKLILEGESPYDIYVRWKPLHKQPIGWNPDLNDGVRMNIRPFVTAGILRSRFTINWNKDRGKNSDGSERLNDLHYSNEQKRDARRKAGLA